MPAYNAECFIADSIRSCLEQTLKNVEVIVIDDGSTDGTISVVRHLAGIDNRVRFIEFGVNHGRAVARNTGNRLALADVICVQDADDISVPKRAAITADYFRNHPDTGMFYGGFSVCNVFKDIMRQIVPLSFDYGKIMKEACEPGKYMETGIGHGTMAYRKSVALKYPYDEKGEFSKLGLDDWKLQLDMFKGGVKFGYTLQPLYLYRQMSDTVSATRDIAAVLNAKKEYLRSNDKIAA